MVPHLQTIESEGYTRRLQSNMFCVSHKKTTKNITDYFMRRNLGIWPSKNPIFHINEWPQYVQLPILFTVHKIPAREVARGRVGLGWVALGELSLRVGSHQVKANTKTTSQTNWCCYFLFNYSHWVMSKIKKIHIPVRGCLVWTKLIGSPTCCYGISEPENTFISILP